MVSTALETVPATRRKILQCIKKEGEVPADAIASRLGVTVQAVRRHLTALEGDGLITHRERSSGPGRPTFLFALTAAGDLLFPRNYEELTNELLDYVKDEDPTLLDRIFDRRAQRRLGRAVERLAGASFADRVRLLAEILDEDGYLADFTQLADGSFVITEHNCAVLNVALRYGHACSSELAFLQEAMPDAEVTRIAHRIGGGHVCAYRVVPRPAAPVQ